MAYALDTQNSTGSPVAKRAKTSQEEPPVHNRLNAVASEVQVIASGARASEKGGKRELFTEETTTALVFENGGVLRLSATVIPGQLLFLTNKDTKREVVAQVRSKRDFRPMIFYVEVEFTEPSPGFWGVDYSTTEAEVPSSGAQVEAFELSPAEENILASEPADPVPAPSAQEILALKNEVEALRKQLKFLTAAGEEPQRLPSEASRDLASSQDSSPALNSPPTDSADSTSNEEDLLPKPALDFHDAKAPAKLAAKPQPPVAKQGVAARSKYATMRKDLLFAAFVLIVAAAAWYQNLLPLLPLPKNLFPSPAPNIAAQPAAQALPKPGAAQPGADKSLQTSDAPTAPPSADSHDAPQLVPLGTAQSSKPELPETPASVKLASDADEAAVREKPEVAASAGKRAAALPTNKSALAPGAPRSDDAALVPPRLIKSVRAIASTSALQDFGAGSADNVTFDALVDVSGHVKTIKGLSGSPALQTAAMEALKQYVYEPATRHGKPVPAHVTVTVKFLFEP